MCPFQCMGALFGLWLGYQSIHFRLGCRGVASDRRCFGFWIFRLGSVPEGYAAACLLMLLGWVGG